MPVLRPVSSHELQQKTDSPALTVDDFPSLNRRWDSTWDLPITDSGLNKPAEWRDVIDLWEEHWSLQGGGGTWTYSFPPRLLPLRVHSAMDFGPGPKERSCTSVFLIWDSQFWKWSTERGFDDLQGSSWEKKGKVPVSFPTWCLAAPVQIVLSGASPGTLPFRKCPDENSYPDGYTGNFTSPFLSGCRLVPSSSLPR